jgi:hypothetical protein
LQLQDELRGFEEELEALDGRDGMQERIRSRDIDLHEARLDGERNAQEAQSQHRSLNGDLMNERQSALPASAHAALLSKIQFKLLEYDEMLMKVRDVNEIERPTRRDYREFRTWYTKNKPLAYEAEEMFVKRKGDLVTLRARAEWGKFDGWIEAHISKMPGMVKNVRFCPLLPTWQASGD